MDTAQKHVMIRLADLTILTQLAASGLFGEAEAMPDTDVDEAAKLIMEYRVVCGLEPHEQA